jgi:sulfite exporter TauE/SafE
MSVGPTNEASKGLITVLIDSVKQRPFTELMALVLAITLIWLGYYELTIGRPALLQQISEINEQSHDHFDANLERILQAEDKRTELFKDMLEGERNGFNGINGNAANGKPNEKAGTGT